MAAEILVVTPAIRALIRDDKIHQIYSHDAVGKEVRHADDERRAVPALHDARSGARRKCLRASRDPNEFLRMIGKSPDDDKKPEAVEAATGRWRAESSSA